MSFEFRVTPTRDGRDSIYARSFAEGDREDVHKKFLFMVNAVKLKGVHTGEAKYVQYGNNFGAIYHIYELTWIQPKRPRWA
jgi:hypothetical protein